MKSIKKMVGSALLATGLAAGVMAMPGQADAAISWNASQMVTNATGTTGLNGVKIDQNTIAQWVQQFTTWILGIAVVLFVLKVVFTAVDRMMFADLKSSGSGANKSVETSGGALQKIPLIGAYAADVPWKEVWIHFGKNLAIVAGAWILVNIVVGVILFAFGAATGGLTGNSSSAS